MSRVGFLFKIIRYLKVFEDIILVNEKKEELKDTNKELRKKIEKKANTMESTQKQLEFKKNVLENKFYKIFGEFEKAIDIFFKEKLKLPIIQEKLRQFATDNFHIRYRELCYLPLPYNKFQLNFFGR